MGLFVSYRTDECRRLKMLPLFAQALKGSLGEAKAALASLPVKMLLRFPTKTTAFWLSSICAK